MSMTPEQQKAHEAITKLEQAFEHFIADVRVLLDPQAALDECRESLAGTTQAQDSGSN